MKRKALLIACSCGRNITEGVKQDVENYADFLMSPQGGGYLEEEIVKLIEKDKKTILKHINQIKEERNDVVFSVFSGHGEYDDIDREERVLEIDNEHDLYESSLTHLASKQILILDTCAGLKSRRILKESSEEKMFHEAKLKNSFSECREKYERLCMKCPDQIIRLYSSHKGEASEDTEEGLGGLYSSSLIEVLKKNIKSKLDIVSAHNEAAQLVEKRSQNKQHPSRRIPKLFPEQFLPGSIN